MTFWITWINLFLYTLYPEHRSQKHLFSKVRGNQIAFNQQQKIRRWVSRFKAWTQFPHTTWRFSSMLQAWTEETQNWTKPLRGRNTPKCMRNSVYVMDKFVTPTYAGGDINWFGGVLFNRLTNFFRTVGKDKLRCAFPTVALAWGGTTKTLIRVHVHTHTHTHASATDFVLGQSRPKPKARAYEYDGGFNVHCFRKSREGHINA